MPVVSTKDSIEWYCKNMGFELAYETVYRGHEIPENVACCFCDGLDTSGGSRQVLVTLGQFSIVRLERDTQLLIPVYNYCLPEKECPSSSDGDPCDLFQNICFPVGEFFPPDTLKPPCNYSGMQSGCGCG